MANLDNSPWWTNLTDYIYTSIERYIVHRRHGSGCSGCRMWRMQEQRNPFAALDRVYRAHLKIDNVYIYNHIYIYTLYMIWHLSAYTYLYHEHTIGIEHWRYFKYYRPGNQVLLLLILRNKLWSTQVTRAAPGGIQLGNNALGFEQGRVPSWDPGAGSCGEILEV